MDTKFKYFHWAMPELNKQLYGLLDVFDNQLLLLTYEFDIAWQLKNLIKSKIVLEIVDFSNQVETVNEKIDNSIVETYGLCDIPAHLFQDLRFLSDSYRDKTKYCQDILIKDFAIVKNNTKFDDFKKDLQQQLFFFHHYLVKANNAQKYDKDSFFYKHLLRSAELGESYQDCLDRFLNISHMCKQDPDFLFTFLKFIKHENLMYE
jgi:hypothetical protein